jgi:hypothetical protein
MHFKCCFLLIGFVDPDVVIPSLDIKFAEYLHSLQIFDALCKVGEWSDILSSDSIEGSIFAQHQWDFLKLPRAFHLKRLATAMSASSIHTKQLLNHVLWLQDYSERF